MEHYIDKEINQMGGYLSKHSMAVGDHAVNEDTVMKEAGRGNNQQQDRGVETRGEGGKGAEKEEARNGE